MVKEERARPDEGLKRKALILTCVLAMTGLGVGSLFGDRGILQLLRQRQRVEALLQEIEELRAENQRIAAAVAALRTDPRAIERLAREELDLARPGETVFLVRPDAPPEAR
jgi:cell division protein FtsB